MGSALKPEELENIPTVIVIHICKFLSTFLHTNTYPRTHTHKHTHTRTHTHTGVHTQTHTDRHTQTHTDTHRQTHTDTHLQTYTQCCLLYNLALYRAAVICRHLINDRRLWSEAARSNQPFGTVVTPNV